MTLSWRLFEGGATGARVREAEANRTRAGAELEALEDGVRLEIQQAALSVRASLASLEAAEEAVGSAQERLALAEGRYETGAGSALELGDAQLAESSARARRAQADYQLSAARAQLSRVLGRA